jgi:hypothetical protein
VRFPFDSGLRAMVSPLLSHKGRVTRADTLSGWIGSEAIFEQRTGFYRAQPNLKGTTGRTIQTLCPNRLQHREALDLRFSDRIHAFLLSFSGMPTAGPV